MSSPFFKPLLLFVLAAVLLGCAPSSGPTERIPLTVDGAQAGAPLTVGLPFPKGALDSPDRVRVVTPEGREVPSQVTQVTSWAPADASVKWIWVFFFAETTGDGTADRYVVEYGPDVRRAPIPAEQRLSVVNSQRTGGFVEIDTGPLRLRVQRTGRDTTGSGFLDRVELDRDGDGFDSTDVVASGALERGSFLDLVDPDGPDRSRAVIDQSFVERGSGPLHAVVRVEGHYAYDRHPDAPFVLRLHAYAGRSQVRVLHTFTYTGDPDRHPPVDGQHALIATGPDDIVDEEALAGDPRWTEPNDRIAATGLALRYRLNGPLRYRTAVHGGDWWNPDAAALLDGPVDAPDHLSLIQHGPNPTRMLPLGDSAPDARIEGFETRLVADSTTRHTATRGRGWMEVRGTENAVGVAVRHFLKEYPKELSIRPDDRHLTAYHWSPASEPTNFARYNADASGGMVDNFATGLTKTTELLYSFHPSTTSSGDVEARMATVLDPPVAHAPPEWYADSKAFGTMAPAENAFPEYERGMQYKFDWWRFNQDWEPWYGVFDHGDGKTYWFRNQWYLWTNNEPAIDGMWWTQFVRTGSRDAYLTALDASRHAMDVDNVHWPAAPTYRGDTNASLDAFQPQEGPEPTPYRGMGRRHARQQWTSMLSAHVWVPGWVWAYYLAGEHRGLDVARMTGDYYQRRIFGAHGLTGRRLYLSVWNLAELYDATKDPSVKEELDARVDRMLRLQRERGGSLLIDRYGYAQPYVANGLQKVVQLTGRADVKDALVRHARWVRDNPPLNHEAESYLASISTLLAGYEYSREPSLLDEAVRRAEGLKTDVLSTPLAELPSQRAAADSLTGVSHLPDGRRGRPGIWRITGGLRVFGWTHASTVPRLIYWLERDPVSGRDGE